MKITAIRTRVFEWKGKFGLSATSKAKPKPHKTPSPNPKMTAFMHR